MRLIDADAIFNGKLLVVSDVAYDAVHAIIEKINNAPTVDAQPVRHGHWEDSSNGWMCSKCFREIHRDYPFCPMCGAKMDGGDGDAVSVED